MTTIEDQRVFQQFAEIFVGFALFRRFFYIGGNLDACTRGKCIQCLFKINVLTLHYELKDVAALIALAETAPGPRLWPDHERRCFLVFMERAKACVVLACMAQIYTGLRDEVYKVYARFD